MFARDLKVAARNLWRKPVLTLAAVCSLALGLGAVTAVFAVFDAVTLKPLAMAEPDRLMAIRETRNGEPTGSNGPRLLDWQQVGAFESATGLYYESRVRTQTGGDPHSVRCLVVFSGAMATAKPRILAGRPFTAQEERGSGTALVAERYWRKGFGADPSVIGQTVALSGQGYTIVGVVGEGYPDDTDFWVPAPADLQVSGRQAGYLGVIARLKTGASKETAQAEVSAAAQKLAREYPASDAGLRASLVPLLEEVSGEARAPLWILLASVAAVLAIVCANLASLLLSRAIDRRRECAIRTALGASRGALFRMILTESMLLASVGGLLGVLVADTGIDLLRTLMPDGVPRLGNAGLDLRSVSAHIVAALASGLLCGIGPALHLARRSEVVRDKGTASQPVRRLRAGVVAAQIAACFLLVCTATELVSLYTRLHNAPRGFRADGVTTVRIEFPWDTPQTRLHTFYREAGTALQAEWVDALPLAGGTQSTSVQGLPHVPAATAGTRSASTGYFRAMGIPLLRGRLFEGRAGVREVVVNESFARRFFPGTDPVGRTVTFGRPKGSAWLVTGVVGDVRQRPTEPRVEPEVWLHYENSYWPYANFVVRGAPSPERLREIVRSVDPGVVVASIAGMNARIAEAEETPRIRGGLTASFAAVALLLAAIGIYGALNSDVASRLRETAIRIALGAAPGRVYGDVLGNAARIALAGTGCGLCVWLVLRPEWSAALVAAPLIAGVTLAAAWLPARRAASVDPVVALREE